MQMCSRVFTKNIISDDEELVHVDDSEIKIPNFKKEQFSDSPKEINQRSSYSKVERQREALSPIN